MGIPNEGARSVVLVGGPDSGKTNFTTRLWLAIKRGDGLVKANGLPDHLDYLEEGAQKLLSAAFVHHTPHGVYKENRIPCQVGTGDQQYVGELVIPDCYGEQWMEIYKKREWSKRWEGHITSRSSCLVFVRAGSPETVAPLDWIQCERLWGEVPPGLGQQGQIQTPTQVLLTDFLQFLNSAFRDRVGGGYRPRVGLIVAAWDLVPRGQQDEIPEQYIAREFPLLHQFMSNNEETFEFSTFGVSIAGGDFDQEPEFKKRCIDQEDPLGFGYVIQTIDGARSSSPDLTLPIAWALRSGPANLNSGISGNSGFRVGPESVWQ